MAGTRTVKSIRIDIVSDVICPWCFLGKRRLDKALAAVPDVTAEIHWRPFFLDPTIPREGIGRQDYLVNKFGEERLATLHAPFEEARLREGVPYQFDKIKRTPNTLDAHRLIRWSHLEHKQQEMTEQLFMAYWSEGQDIGDQIVLASISENLGMDVRGKLASDVDAESVLQEANQSIQMGVTGVPCFILSQKYGLSGAQPPDQLIAAIEKLAA
jgi:predicted DsbA family dithiol-disulfide isomerase